MDISRLSAKQKRLQVWQDFAHSNQVKPEIRSLLDSYLAEYAKLLKDCWEAGNILPEHIIRMGDLERELQDLNEFTRLQA